MVGVRKKFYKSKNLTSTDFYKRSTDFKDLEDSVYTLWYLQYKENARNVFNLYKNKGGTKSLSEIVLSNRRMLRYQDLKYKGGVI